MIGLPLALWICLAGGPPASSNDAPSMRIDPRQLQLWQRLNGYSGIAWPTGGPAGAAGPSATASRVPPFFLVVGNFASYYEAQGYGGNTDTVREDLIEVESNEGVKITTSGFTALKTPASSGCSVAYALEICSGTVDNVGPVLAGPISGTDTGFNGKTLTLTAANAPFNGVMVLRLTRQLTLSKGAIGATKLTATGTLKIGHD